MRSFFPLLVVVLAGCERVAMPAAGPPAAAAAAARYPLRTDLLATAVGDLGAPPKWPAAGWPPLRAVQVGAPAPDAEFVSLLGPKVARVTPQPRKGSILNPETNLTAAQRELIAALLDAAFGTPAAPTVRVPSAEQARARLSEVMKPAELKAALADAGAATEGLGLGDAALARGGVLYRRWCLQCHGPTGAGDAAQAIERGPMPRDYRRGVFKFVTCFPAGPPKPGQLGKARKDDLKRTVRKGLEGSMMPPFPQFSDAELDDLTGYVIHLSVRGECEAEAITRAVKLVTNPRDDDPGEFDKAFAEQVLFQQFLEALGNWKRAAESPIPVPPEHTPTDADRLASAARGYRSFAATCLACHVDYGRAEQLKFDVWGTVVQPRNLTLGVYRGGRRGEDLYARVYGGIYPSTMPDSKAKAAPTPDRPDEIWDIVHFLQLLADPHGRRQLRQYDPAIRVE